MDLTENYHPQPKKIFNKKPSKIGGFFYPTKNFIGCVSGP